MPNLATLRYAPWDVAVDREFPPFLWPLTLVSDGSLLAMVPAVTTYDALPVSGNILHIVTCTVKNGLLTVVYVLRLLGSYPCLMLKSRANCK